MAGKGLSEKENPAPIKAYHEWFLDIYQTGLHPVTLDEETKRAYVGSYGPRTITLENNTLFYQREERSRMKMIPMADDVFFFEENDSFRIRFIREGNRVVAVEGQNPEGETDRHETGAG